MTGPGWMNAVGQFGHSSQALSQDFRYPRNAFALPWLNHTRGTQGQQAHHGANLEPSSATVREPQDVVVETVLLVPHSFWTRLVHGPCDPEEMLGELNGYVLVIIVMGRQLHCNLEHVLGEQGNPCRTVCLFEGPTRR